MMALFSASVVAEDINLYAAASLTEAITELSNIYKNAHPDIVLKTSFAGSSTLAKQIENGAPADIFISADKDWADYLQNRGLLISESRKNLLGNALVLIAPLGEQTAKVELSREYNFAKSFNGRLCTGEPAYVPLGKYAKQALDYYGWWDAIAPRVVGTEDVRTALAFVERGECSLGIVYKTDAQRSKKVVVIAKFPAASHTPIVYPGGLTNAAGKDSQALWEFLQSDAAKTIFERYGFSIAN